MIPFFVSFLTCLSAFFRSRYNLGIEILERTVSRYLQRLSPAVDARKLSVPRIPSERHSINSSELLAIRKEFPSGTHSEKCVLV